MKQQYLHITFHKHNQKLIDTFDALIGEYLAQGFRLSVRQVYYQCIARDIFPDSWIDPAYNARHGLPANTKNTLKNYKHLASLLNDGRLAGMLDWDAIEDRGRDVVMRNRYLSGKDVLKIAERAYHMDMWKGQKRRVFVIVEKAALAGVLEGVCHRWDVPLLAARGYPSVSVLREMALDHFKPALMAGQRPLLLHLGDHDPSGIDMTRDLSERLDMFAEHALNMRRIALTMEQIQETNPPPNPAKTTDARFKQYAEEFGEDSWELDALEPKYLVKLLEKHVKGAIKMSVWDDRAAEVESIRAKLKKVADDYHD